ncbi:MAG: hypothetical protein KAX40_11850, partial [Herpetosiphon sp.]|nr:hypothetical protein [Herpetosiphon sp.]
MGAWGGLCMFDYTAFITRVVPAFQVGETHPLIHHVLAEAHHNLSSDFRGLDQVINHCNATLTDCSLGQHFWVHAGIIQSTIDRSGHGWGYAELASLFEAMLTTYCISQCSVFGLSVNHVGLRLFGEELGWDTLTHELIHYLDTRCQYWAHGNGGYGEGIQGWL